VARFVIRRLFLAQLLTLLVAALGDPAGALAAEGWRVVGQLGGPTSAVAVQGNYAYVGIGLRLTVLDISDPANPRELGATAPFPYFVQGIAVRGTRAYVAAGGAGLRIVDISDPARPSELGAWDSPGYAEGVAVAGTMAYLADGPYGLCVVDVSDPAIPKRLSSAFELNYAFDVVIAGSYAYVAGAGAGLLVADVSDADLPHEVATLDTPGYAYDVAVVGTMAYVADGWAGLQVVDVSNPAKPSTRGSCAVPGWVLAVAVSGATVYAADGADGIRAIDVSDPTDPHEEGALELEGFARRLAVTGSTALVADSREGLRVITFADRARPTQVAVHRPLAEALSVAVSGSYAYVAAGFAGLRVVDVSDPVHPREVAAYDTEGGYAGRVALSGSRLYLTTTLAGPYWLHVIDIADPHIPKRIGTVHKTTSMGSYMDVAVAGDTLFVTDEFGLRLLSVGDPAHPTMIGFIALSDNNNATLGVAVAGSLAYVANTGSGVRIVDVSNPSNLRVVGVYDSPGIASGVAVASSTLYLADGACGMEVVDVSNPAAPVELGSIETPGTANAVTLSNGLAYVSNSGSGVQMVDVSDPSHPSVVGSCDTPGYATFMAVGGDHLFVADGLGGLAVLDRSASPTTPANIDSRSASTKPSFFTNLAPPSSPRAFPVAQAAAGATTPPPAAKARDETRTSAPTTCVVRSTADSGPGTLRACLETARRGDTVTFDPAVFPPTNSARIRLASELPAITAGGVTIDGSNAGVILDGGGVTSNACGVRLQSDDNRVMGLQIVNFSLADLWVEGSRNLLGGDRRLGQGPMGQGNVLGTSANGINLGMEGNVVVGNLIGVDATGTVALPNYVGVLVGGDSNRLGGPTTGERNIVSGNVWGVKVFNGRNVIIGNYIGTDVSGEHPLGNNVGVVVETGACNNVVGGTAPGERNVISGNRAYGLIIADPSSAHNTVIGNIIGLDATGTGKLGNRRGVMIWSSAFNRVGGTRPEERNVISGNQQGVVLSGKELGDNLVLGNLIGTDPSGTLALGNDDAGVIIDQGTRHNIVGGVSEGEQNVISGNGTGASIWCAGVEYNAIVGNLIGSDVSGAAPLPNLSSGVDLTDYSARTLVQRNTIVFNGAHGVRVERSAYNTLRRNSIHSNVNGGILASCEDGGCAPVPVITAVTTSTVSGTACAGCTVEVFSDHDGQGKLYEGTAVANGTSAFTFTKTGWLAGPNVTATATDGAGSTSAFSSPVRVPPRPPRRHLGRS
jgi:parallel beta-helix repeat protein